MMFRKWIICFLLLGGISANAQETDSLEFNFIVGDSVIVFRTLTITSYHIPGPNRAHKVTSLSSDSLNQLLAFNLAEALKQGTPLFIKSYGANGIGSLNLRGTGASHTKVYWNGIDISPPGLGLMDLSLLPSDPNDYMELSYGAGALPLSSGNIGGGLHIHALPYKNDLPKGRMQIGGGSFGRQAYQFNYNHDLKNWKSQSSINYQSSENNFRYRLPGESERSHEMQHAAIEQLHLKQGLYYRPQSKPQHHFSLNAWYNFTNREIPKIVLANQSLFDRMEDENLYLNGDWQYEINGKQDRVQWTTGLVNSSNRFFLNNASEPNRNDYQSYQSNFKYVIGHRYKSGLYSLSSDVSLQNRYDLVNNDAYSQAQSRFTNALYASAKLFLNSGWEFAWQGRLETFDFEIAPITGSLSITYQRNHKRKIYANISRNYRLPGLNDLYWQPGGNLNLEPELAHGFDLGYQQIKESGNFKQTWQLNTFWMLVENWIQWSPENGIWTAQNYKEVENYGLEADWNFQWLWGKWQFNTGLQYQYLQSINLGGIANSNLEGKALPFNPSHNLNSQFSLVYGDFNLAYQINFTDRYYLDEANYYYLPSYFIQDLRMGYKTSWQRQDFKVQLGINNLGNRDYQIIAWRPEPGLHFYFAIVWEWQRR